MLKVGDKAPDFSLPNQDNQDVRLSELLKKSVVVLYFYPKDFTSGCTAESCSFRDRNDDFAQYNAQVIGISKDGAESHQGFIAKHKLPYPLLTDAEGAVAKLFGLKKVLGFLPPRVTIVIDRDSTIRYVYDSSLHMDEHSKGALEVVKALKR